MEEKIRKMFEEIRSLYAAELPIWMAEYQETGRMNNDPYIFNWQKFFSPIENLVWADIRELALPFCPQLPVLNYFLDFGCPYLRIGIECDGKAWHEDERDKKRDARLAEAGWSIFRIEGRECVRHLDQPWNEYGDDASIEHVAKWFMTTSEGIIYAIKHAYFVDRNEWSGFAKEHANFIDATLFEHNTTPNVSVPRPRPVKETGVQHIAESLGDYLDLLQRRMRNAKAGPSSLLRGSIYLDSESAEPR